MTTYDLGDGVNLEHLVYDRDGQLTDAIVALTVTKPDGTTLTPAITHPSTGLYRAATFGPDVVGAWAYAWTVTGAVLDIAAGAFVVADPGPALYATLPQLKHYLKLPADDTEDDEELLSALESVSREIDDVCERTFTRDDVASTRTFEPVGAGLVLLDDFYTLTDLVIAVDGATWAVADYTLLPHNGRLNGRPWPYNRLQARTWRLPLGGPSVAVTARWGWAAVPAPVHEACKIAASETSALKDARFGVAGFGAMGDIRVRDNPMVMKKLRPYLRSPVKVA